MIKYPKVSVVTITYGHENYITKTLEGVLMQKYPGEIEFIIANDNSPDGTDKIITDYVSQNEIPPNFTIRYEKHKVNKGMMPNFLWAMNQISGEYIALCEGDDYWIDPLKLQKQVDFLDQNPVYGLVATDFNLLDQFTGKLSLSVFKNQPSKFVKYTNFEDFLLAAGYMAPCTWLLRKEFLPKNTKNYVDGTFPWLLDIFIKSKVYVLPDTTTVYRYLSESASHSKSIEKRYKLAAGILDIQLDYVRDYNLPDHFKLRVLEKYYLSVLPSIVVLDLKDEIKKALLYIPKKQRTKRDIFLFLISSSWFGKKMLLQLYKYKGIAT